jgi:hypothetical protein
MSIHDRVDSHLKGWAYSGRSNGQPCSFLGLCVSQLAHQPPPSADLLKELSISGALRRETVEEILQLLAPLSGDVPPSTYSRLRRFVCLDTARKSKKKQSGECLFNFFANRMLIVSLQLPLSERDRFLLIQLDGNLRLGQNGRQHEDLSNIQVEPMK